MLFRLGCFSIALLGKRKVSGGLAIAMSHHCSFSFPTSSNLPIELYYRPRAQHPKKRFFVSKSSSEQPERWLAPLLNPSFRHRFCLFFFVFFWQTSWFWFLGWPLSLQNEVFFKKLARWTLSQRELNHCKNHLEFEVSFLPKSKKNFERKRTNL